MAVGHDFQNKKMAKINTSNISEFQLKLINWYVLNGRKFPWREVSLSEYQYIIAEVLLQRTKAETIKIFYPIFIRKFPSWKTLALVELEVLESELRSIGLYRQRALRLKKLAEYLIQKNEFLPSIRSDLEKIPYMGQYIANAVELFIFKSRCHY